MYKNTACTLNGKHTYRDYGLYVTNISPVSPPEVRREVITIPGRNGEIDLTEALTGYPIYGNRERKKTSRRMVGVYEPFSKRNPWKTSEGYF